MSCSSVSVSLFLFTCFITHTGYFFTQQVYKRLFLFIPGKKVDACELLIADLKKVISTIIFNILIIYYFHTEKTNRGQWATSLIWTTILKSQKLGSFQTQRTESSGLLFKLVIFVYQLTSISPVISRIFYHVSPHNSGKLKS